ncbi:hypothetical protein ABW20_dc0109880 [Dactylellina cionopaga]|nr:hypothetical protein ABW20_dc0109880 [Dactylellina cionopaga]
MQHIYQILDCNDTAPAHGCADSILVSKQIELNSIDFPESKSGENLAALISKISAPPIYISPQYLGYIQDVSKSLHTAITDIVSRWWDDTNLSEAIPLDPGIKRLLERLEHEGFTWRSGSWRPDFLVEENSEKSHPQIKICEINARFGFNGFFCTHGITNGYYKNNMSPIQPAFSQVCLSAGFWRIGDFDVANERIPLQFGDVFGHVFDTTKPVHIVKGREAGYDIHHLAKELSNDVFFVHVSELRIAPTNAGKQLLYFVGGKEVEIFQVVLELHQDELLSLPENLLWEISIRVRINDMRTIMLVHDKRMLGLVRQQLANLVVRDVLSPQAATLLENSIADTYIPGSSEYQKALSSPRDQQWLFKPAGSGKGAGIVFRQDLSEEHWQSFVGNAQIPHVLQRAVNHKVFNLVMPRDQGSIKRVPWGMVGTFFLVDGYFSGFGPWRSSAEKICALSRGGSWMMAVCDRACLPFIVHPKPREVRYPSRTASEYSKDSQKFPQKIVEAFSTPSSHPSSNYLVIKNGLN